MQVLGFCPVVLISHGNRVLLHGAEKPSVDRTIVACLAAAGAGCTVQQPDGILGSPESHPMSTRDLSKAQIKALQWLAGQARGDTATRDVMNRLAELGYVGRAW